MNPLHLLLADDAGPSLPDGADPALLDVAPGPSGQRKVDHLWSEDGTNDLAVQRWAVVYPKARPELLAAIAPLMALREAQQKAKPLTWALDPKDDGKALHQHIYDGDLPPAEQPRYLLILGDLDEIDADVQVNLAASGAVGRLAFDRIDDYRSYAEKLVRWDPVAMEDPPRLLLYGAYDADDGAMAAGERDLLAPVASAAERGELSASLPLHSFGRTGQTALDGLRDLLVAAEAKAPTLLLSVTHGLGSARWTPQERRERQGAVRVAPNVALDAAALRERAFLPGGLWACFACFGAGTPARSRFEPWLRELVARGAMGGAPDVLRTLATDRPFVSGLAKSALANPQGPLGVLGHVDLAWGWSFRDEASGGQSRAGRFGSLLASAAKGDRFGLGLGPIGRAQRGAAHRLIEAADLDQRGELGDNQRKMRGHDWMTWHDLGAWVLLGDPAARLPRAAPAPAAAVDLMGFSVAASSQKAAGTGPDIETVESLILARLAGEPGARAQAEAQGLSWTELRRLEQIYTEAGRKALAADRG